MRLPWRRPAPARPPQRRMIPDRWQGVADLCHLFDDFQAILDEAASISTGGTPPPDLYGRLKHCLAIGFWDEDEHQTWLEVLRVHQRALIGPLPDYAEILDATARIRSLVMVGQSRLNKLRAVHAVPGSARILHLPRRNL